MSTVPVQQYALRHLVSADFAADRTALEAFMRVEIASRLLEEPGDCEILPDTFDLQVIERSVMYGKPVLTQDEIDAGMTGDEKMAVATVRCFRKPGA